MSTTIKGQLGLNNPVKLANLIQQIGKVIGFRQMFRLTVKGEMAHE